MRSAGSGKHRVEMDPEARRHLAKFSDGDARKCLNALEIGVLTTPPDKKGVVHFTLEVAEESIQTESDRLRSRGRRALRHDQRIHQEHARLGRERARSTGWRKCCTLARTFASSPGGLSSSRAKMSAWPIAEALPLAIATQQAVEFVGMPEARIPLAHAVCLHVPGEKKSRSLRGVRRGDGRNRSGANRTRARRS